MDSRTEAFSRHRARLATIIVVLAVAACIAVANLSSEPLAAADIGKVFRGATIERPCGWPFTWYWRSPVVRVMRATNPIAIQWAVSRYSAGHLATNVVLWLTILAVVLLCGKWLTRRYRPRLRWRPRAATVFALLLGTAFTALANLSSDIGPGQPQPHSCGWPLIWYWQSYIAVFWQNFSEWHFSAAALAGNFLIWACLLALIAVTCERLVRRYQPRPRWSLRTMLAGVALVAVVCAWFVNARKRVKDEDELISRVQPHHGVVYLKGQGPAWLDLFRADRLRRRVVGVYIRDLTREMNEVGLFKSLAKLPQLRYLEVQPVLIHEAELVLGEMRQLRALGVRCRIHKREDQLTMLTAIGKLTELEHLSVSVSVAHRGDLDPLSGLSNLKSLTLEIHGEIDPHDGLAALGKLPRLEHLLLTTWQVSSVDLASLAGLTKLKSLRIQCTPGGLAPLPGLPGLEALDLTHLPGGDASLGRLADCPRLKSLCLAQTGVSAAGLASLASVQLLRELAIDEDTLAAAGLESLTALKSLKSLHITHVMEEYMDDDDFSSAIVLDDGENLDVPSSGLDRLRHAIDSLRQAHPGIVIDTDYEGFEERAFQRLFKLGPPPGSQPAL